MVQPSRITNDTNVWLSALYFRGKPAQIVNLIEEREIVSVTSSFILEELRKKMVVDFETPSYAANGTLAYIASLSELVSLKGEDFRLRDPADNKILETAVVGKCDWLVTGDKDLLSVEKYSNVYIVKPEQFLERYKRG